MKALILKGKYTGTLCEVSQWCNNWFMLDSDIVAIATKPYSPSSLAFTTAGMREILDHKNNGILFLLYQTALTTPRQTKVFDKENIYIFTFKRHNGRPTT